ncbi:4-hydroxybutyrate CoA-transferase [Thermanaerosceptrum fracticalcis]|uniref:4-hydroxybutyrate CoA-transferase n=1 Tax=Thermanaerosceptrum fracticalcis TaxID=1712410 RepID=A0A7G6E3T8_THEFR|nr:acetyl-CoA hydrolase/transferase C-terminal domain-containing protein [Thermanaerosceptrum fracticalcis]QNB46742.1 4-hydroxybutyrate CoA-transferase [Thermanaerosceptrum fracticalcis]
MVWWQKIYAERTVSAEEAVKCIHSGDRVVVQHACGEPWSTIEALVARAGELENVEIIHQVPMGPGKYCRPEYAKSFRHNSMFAGAPTREAIAQGRAEYTPVFISEIARLFRDAYLPVDVALIQVSPPDKDGYCSLGISIDYSKPAAECARIVVAEVNEQMPKVYGDTFLHVSEIDYFVENTHPLYVLDRPKIGPVEEKIGNNIAQLIKDGDTLQLGIGAIPDAVLTFLKDRKDLGIHSEMISDGVMELVKSGVITGRKKTLHPGKIVSNFAMGTREFYDFLHENAMVEFYPGNYTNDPFIICQNDNMVSINSAIQVDLMGQVAAETIGYQQYSGVGGQVDFVRGAVRAKNGRSIIAIPSTAAKGTVSRVVARLDEGAAVTTSRNDVHYIVTEYGAANLRGKTLRQRAEALINIAHPDFRDELRAEAKKRNLL